MPTSDPATLLLLPPRGFYAGVIRAIAIVASGLQNLGRRVKVGAAMIGPPGSTASDWELPPELHDFLVAQAINQTGKPGICIQMKVGWAKDDVRFALPEELTS